MTTRRADRGTILPLVLVVVVVLGAVIAALATYSSSTIRYGQVVERSSDRLASAQGALDNVLESIDRNASLCVISALPALAGGYDFDLGAPINGIDPTINCRLVGGELTGVNQFAIILTEGGNVTDELLTITQGGQNANRKVIEGPVYMARAPRHTGTDPSLELNADLTLRDGDLWYSAVDCPDPSVDIPTTGFDLLITPAGFGPRCVEETWQTLFGAFQPMVPTNITSTPVQSSATPSPDATGCYVWPAGQYTTPPILGSGFNYFQSGDYYFDLAFPGAFDIGQASVLFGTPPVTGPSVENYQASPPPSPHPCENAWLTDPDQGGATLYLDNESHIVVGENGAIEVTGRDQAGDNVAIQALPTTNRITNQPRLIDVQGGTNKQIALHGMLWAPDSSVELANVANTAVAALTGGAVVAELHLGAPANASNLLISAGGSPSSAILEITATAESAEGNGTTEVRARVEYENGNYALLSRRVRCLTPGDC